MKKYLCLLASLCLFCLFGCGKQTSIEEETIQTATTIIEESDISQELQPTIYENTRQVRTVRINNVNYYDMNRIEVEIPEATEDIITGVITSFVDNSEFPNDNDQCNFGVGYEYQQKNEEFVYVKINDEWNLFCSNEDGENIISFMDRLYLKTELSNSTLEWLEHYNELSKEEQLSLSSIPAELCETSINYEVLENENFNLEDNKENLIDSESDIIDNTTLETVVETPTDNSVNTVNGNNNGDFIP